jgi:acetaldehyde dehydrogenase (acetylating)
MTLGCGSWGGNVTSDNVSPLHLMDIKRVAFEVRPVKSARPAVGVQTVAGATKPAAQPVGAGGKIDRQEIAAIVDRFLAGKRDEAPAASPLPKPEIEAEAGSMYAPAPPPPPKVVQPVSKPAAPAPSANGNKTAVDFVSEDDVRRAIQKGDKIFINSKTIITPAARDLGEPAEVFAKV